MPKDYYRLQFLVDTENDSIKKEMEVSIKAGKLVGKLYDLILKQYKNPNSPETFKSLNILCVRLVFCLTRPENRDSYINDDLSAFPYVNGGLFADENIEIPRFTEEIVNLLLNGASKVFNWSEISPTIFGAVFESTLNLETCRSGGMG